MNHHLNIFYLLPLIFLLWLANVADKRRNETSENRNAVIAVYALLILFWVIVLAAGIFALLMGIAYQRYADIAVLSSHYAEQGLDPQTTVQFMHSLPRLGAGAMVLALLGMAALLPFVRRLMARLIPISPTSVVHAVALNYSIQIFTFHWLVASIGLDLTAETLESLPQSPPEQMIVLLWLRTIFLIMMALIGVGWLSRRDWRSVLQRLGLTRPGWRDIAAGMGMGLALLLLVTPIMLLLYKIGFAPDPNVKRLERLFIIPLTTSLPGVFSMGAAAALGEELVFRGALQPRFGILLTAIIFALTHWQYGASTSTLGIFIFGLVAGWMRQRRNTTSSIFLHATYNIIIGLLFFLLG